MLRNYLLSISQTHAKKFGSSTDLQIVGDCAGENTSQSAHALKSPLQADILKILCLWNYLANIALVPCSGKDKLHLVLYFILMLRDEVPR